MRPGSARFGPVRPGSARDTEVLGLVPNGTLLMYHLESTAPWPGGELRRVGFGAATRRVSCRFAQRKISAQRPELPRKHEPSTGSGAGFNHDAG